MITAFLFMVTTPHVLRELDLLLRINILGKAYLAVAVRARVPSADTFVGLSYESMCTHCMFLFWCVTFVVIVVFAWKVSKLTKMSRVNL